MSIHPVHPVPKPLTNRRRLSVKDTHKGIRSRLFLVGSDGKLIGRRPDVWSTNFDRCQDCGTTEKPHESRGLCHACFARWRYRTNHNGYRDRDRARCKRYRMRDDIEEKQRAWDEFRKSDPRHKELIRQTKLRWAKKNAKFAPGKEVEYELIPRHWITGTVIENGRGGAIVQFATMKERIPHRFLRLKVADNKFGDAA